MNRYILIFPLFISLTMFSQETNNDVVEDIPTKLEQLIIDIESEIDIEKRFDFSRSNTKERQLQDLKRINNKLKSDLKAAEDLSVRLIAEFDENEKQLSELEEKLTLKLGNLGEMFGVVKQVSGQTRGEFKNSITNIDNPDRDAFLKNLSESKNYQIFQIFQPYGLNWLKKFVMQKQLKLLKQKCSLQMEIIVNLRY